MPIFNVTTITPHVNHFIKEYFVEAETEDEAIEIVERGDQDPEEEYHADTDTEHGEEQVENCFEWESKE